MVILETINNLLPALLGEAHFGLPAGIVLGLDVSDDPICDRPEKAHWRGRYRSCGRLPLPLYCGLHLVLAPPGNPCSRSWR